MKTSTEQKRAVVVGAMGGYGQQMCLELLERGFEVIGVVRNPQKAAVLRGMGARVEQGNALDQAAMTQLCQGAECVVFAANLPYPQWKEFGVEMASSVAHAAAKAGATLLFPGNVDGYAPGLDLQENEAQNPPSQLGEIRVCMEAKAAQIMGASRGRLLILRGGDFFGPRAPSSWMNELLKGVSKGGGLSYPTQLQRRHQWADLPDFAKAHVALFEAQRAGNAQALGKQVLWLNFPGHFITGHRLLQAAQFATGRQHLGAKPLSPGAC